jgi:uncharacterized protein YcbX
LHVYPVKGCGGLALARADVHVTGLATAGVHDREWMVVDGHAAFVTQRESPRLAQVATTIVDGELALSAPDAGTIAIAPRDGGSRAHEVTVWRSNVRGFDAGDAAAKWISAFLRKEVRLVRFDGSKARICNPDYAGDSGAHTMFADGYPVLVIGQASLDDLNARLAGKGERTLPMNRFRPNIVVEGLPPYEEDHADTLECDGVALRMVKPCVRCKVTTTDQATGRVGVEPLHTLSTYRRDDALAGVTFGMNAIVIDGAGRTLSVGQTARIEYRF